MCTLPPATARVARGQAPRLHIFPCVPRRCVDDGFTTSPDRGQPYPPLRSPFGLEDITIQVCGDGAVAAVGVDVDLAAGAEWYETTAVDEAAAAV
jgi:hypothetical protein